MERLVHCIYACRAAEDISGRVLSEMLHYARIANEAAGVTGLLLHPPGGFFQVLEGRPLAVEATIDRIYSDPRLSGFMQLIFEPIAQRSFAGWSLGYAELSAAEYLQIVGNEHVYGRGSPCLATLDSAGARRLFDAFASGAWRTRVWSDARTAEQSA